MWPFLRSTTSETKLIHPHGTGTRFLFYCHDTFGLGHVRRTLALAEFFTTALPGAEALIATGSPLAHAYTLPPRVDYVKLPAVTKLPSGAYRALSLDMEFAAIRDLRATLLRETARAYRPDVFLVDHAPQGLKNEALPTLTMLRAQQPECLRVVGLRDVIDCSATVRRNWTEEGVYNTLEDDYDLILVYGAQKLYDVAEEYALPSRVARRVRYCGYLDRVPDVEESSTTPTASAPDDQRADERPLVVLTAGGGGDGFDLLHTYLLGLQELARPPLRSVLLTGPLMSADEQSALRELAERLPQGTVRIEAFLADPLPLLRSADLVVAMAGYNTVCELLALKQRVLLVPRTTPRQEQLLRATLLERHGLVAMMHPDNLDPSSLQAAVRRALVQPRPRAAEIAATGITFDGQSRAAQAIMSELMARRVVGRRPALVQARAS
jgi:predicted glycosyltransferase